MSAALPLTSISPSTTPHRVALLGGSGLVGHALLQQLLADPDVHAVHLLLRRPLLQPITDPRLHCHLIDFAESDWHRLLAVDAVFCCLGSTIKQAGSQAAFRAIDHELVLTAATAAKAAGAGHFLVISALGADPASGVFYNRVKGEMERDLQQLGLAKLSIFRPSLLAGPRQEFRFGERLGLLLAWLLPAKWRSISATRVARAMWRASREQQEPFRIYPSDVMQKA
ncbi:MAG TPA: NAD(P)H-binding protein [Permianibacter sp.]|nr:NAD(P)H-binding protein [Permianibacter sp.]